MMEWTEIRELETERLILRRFTTADAEAIFRNWASDEEVTKYLTWPTHRSIEASQWFANFCVESYNGQDGYQWAIQLKDTGELIGNIAVVRLRLAVGEAELGWVIGRRWWGQGIMPEAGRAVTAFLFEAGFNRVCAKHDVNNPKSGRVMQKLGMTKEGVLRGAGLNNQGIADVAVYSILRREWEA